MIASSLALLILAASQPAHPEVLPSGRYGLPERSYVLAEVDVIDGTGAPPKRRQSIVIERGRITYVGDAAEAPSAAGAERLELAGHTVLPGLVAMHEHIVEGNGTTPALLLANGVTTARMAGTDRPFTELAIRRWIQEGRIPGPELFLTAPFVSEPFENLVRYKFAALRDLADEDDARRFVTYWAAEGFDAIKVYRGMREPMLRVLVAEARRHNIYVLGHIQRVGCVDAARAGMRSVEHGLMVCLADVTDPQGRPVEGATAPAVRERIATLVELGVAITETPVDLSPLTPAELDVLHVGARAEYERLIREGGVGPGVVPADDEQAAPGQTVAFFRAGGHVMLGADSSGVPRIPGFANIRALKLLYSAYGFEPVEAIRVATLEGARFLGIDDRTGSVVAGKEADLMIVRGHPHRRFADVGNVELVFSNGALVRTAALLQDMRGKHLRQN